MGCQTAVMIWKNSLDGWQGYAADNEKFLYLKQKGFDYVKNNFTYTILENYNSKVKDEYILKRESWWKDVLKTRKFGYNSN